MKESIHKRILLYMVVPVSIVLQALLLVMQLQCITFADRDIISGWLSADNLYYIGYAVWLYAAVLFVIYNLTKKMTPGYMITGVFTLIFGVINNMKWNALNECVTLSDLSKLSEAAKVAEDAEFHMWKGTWFVVFSLLVTLFLWIFLDMHVSKTVAKRTAYRKACLMGCVLCLTGLIVFSVIDGKKSSVQQLTSAVSSERTGPLVYWTQSLFQEKERTPYTVDEAWNSYEQYVRKGKKEAGSSTQETGVQPNIIVIMSEAFYDLDRLEGLVTYSEDPMKDYRAVCKEGVAGDLYVNVYGGGTHFTEFEFLTGWNTRGMKTGSVPYKEYFSENQPSFARYLKDQGYATMAIHPYDGKFWNRYVAYPRLGFERFVDRSRMTYQDMCGYISDESLTKEIVLQYESKQEGKPMFCFAVSIANHIAILNGEEKVNAPDDITVTYADDLGYGPNKKRWVQEYVSGIAKSGKALRELTDYLKQQSEPTIVVFFGDHAPSYALDQLENGEKKLAYSTPYVIWGNYDWQKAGKGENVSASYLSTYLMQLLGMPLADQNYYNIAMRNEYPVDTRYMIQNKEGKSYPDFSKEQQRVYYEHALDLKKHVDTLLRSPERIESIWTSVKNTGK